MRRCALLLVVLVLLEAACSRRPAAWPRAVSLYDGRDLAGWVQRGDAATIWKADGEVIVGAADARAKGHGFLATEREYGDFVLDLDFAVDPTYRAGVQVRSMSYPAYYGGVVHGDQVVIAPGATTGGIMEEGGRHWLYDLKGNGAILKAYRSAGWNHLTVACIGDTIKTWLNGVEGANLRDAKTPVGFIALEVNRGGPERREARFRNIRLLPLDQAAAARRTYVEVPEIAPTSLWTPPVLTQPENRPSPGTATVFKHPPRRLDGGGPPQAGTIAR